jgi:germination protein M
MKRLLLIFLILLLLLVGCAWYGTADEAEEDGYLLYFQERDLDDGAGGSALRAVETRVPEGETAQVAEGLVRGLLSGPHDETLTNPIPAGTTLLSLTLEGSRAVVDLSSTYGTLSGVALTLADQALTLTLTQLPEIASVKITVRGRELAYRSAQVFTGRDVLLAPEGDVISTVPVTLYFPDEDGLLTAEERVLELYEGDTQVSAVVRGVEDGPLDKTLSDALPEGFRVKSVWLEEDLCYVNLSSGALDTLSEDTPLEQALWALARSLCSLDTVSEVRFLVDGEFAELYGTADVAQPYSLF